ncbi:MAG TPA: dipicolinate synthase subunit DpsA [Clostridia bacterium]|nr:dipicolinate synthase subunit DpsA [Clostridia bacterium]
MDNRLAFTVIGGDKRQLELIYILLEMGHKVSALGFDKLGNSGVNLYTTMDTRLFNCNVLLLPIPLRDKRGNINIKESNIIVTLRDIMESIEDIKPWIVLGKADEKFIEAASAKNISYMDIIEKESFSILNAIPTAEGAIQRAMEMMDITIHGAKALVLGYGRIGKSLSRMLKGIGAHVTVEARKREDLAWILENGFNPVHLKEIDAVLPHQDIIFNTVPHLILDRYKLSKIKSETVIIDLASYPGGVDFPVASQLGIKASLDLGLPGLVAPKTSARIIYKVIMDSLPKEVISI